MVMCTERSKKYKERVMAMMTRKDMSKRRFMFYVGNVDVGRSEAPISLILLDMTNDDIQAYEECRHLNQQVTVAQL